MKTYAKRYSTEKIRTEPTSAETWICLCGNTPSRYGFYPISYAGVLVEPTPEDWTTNECVCASCGRVIDRGTLLVTRRVEIATLS